MRKCIIFLISLLNAWNCLGQWQSLDNGIYVTGKKLFYDSSGGSLYVTGYIFMVDSMQINGIGVWDGTNWDSLRNSQILDRSTYAIEKYKGKLYLSGLFDVSPGCSESLAFWSDTSWVQTTDKVCGGVYTFKIYNNELYLGGPFTQIGSMNANLIAKYDGTNFTPLSIPSKAGGFSVQAIEFYQGQMYLGGNFYDTITGVNDLERFDGISYQPFGGNGLPSGFSFVSSMVVYKNELYIAGYFSVADGAPANSIMRWDGNQFHDVGGGVNGGILNMRIYNDELYVCGDFTFAGNQSINYLAKWNGNSWSSVINSILNIPNVYDFLIIGNDLYITGGFSMIDSIPIRGIAMYPGLIGVDEIENNISVRIFPIPTVQSISVSINGGSSYNYSIFDIIGQSIQTGNFTGREYIIHISTFPPGIYFLSIENERSRVVKKFIKN
jgi:hypothetical protein